MRLGGGAGIITTFRNPFVLDTTCDSRTFIFCATGTPTPMRNSKPSSATLITLITAVVAMAGAATLALTGIAEAGMGMGMSTGVAAIVMTCS